MRYVLDTNIILHYLRKSPLAQRLDEQFAPISNQNEPFLPVVVRGEIESLAIQNNWGEQRMKSVEAFLGQLITADINAEDVIIRYAEIDAFSQGKLPGKILGTSSRNMGKNDLWIAAIASVLNATDANFDHLNGNFLTVERIALPSP